MLPQPSGYAALPQPLIHNFWLYLDVISGNLLSRFSVGISLVATSGYNVIRDNTIAYKTAAWESPNDTNIFDGNIERSLP